MSPYKGLMPYEEEDSDFFFGRTREVDLIIANLFAAPATVLLGTSGVGKSSLLRAGVISRLRPRTDMLPVLCSTWREDPSGKLRSVVADAIAKVARERDSGIPVRPRTLAEEIRLQAKRANRHVMLILDQFEEFFLYHPADHPFLEELAEAVNTSALNPRSADYVAMGADEALDESTESAEDMRRPAAAVRDMVARALYSLSDAQRELAFKLFRQLLTPDGAKATATLSDLAAGTGAAREHIEALCQQLGTAGLLHRQDFRSGDFVSTHYELTHDVIARVVRDWIVQQDPVRAAVDHWLTSPSPAPTSYVFSLREDALAKLDLFEGRIPDLMQRLLRLENLDRDGGKEAITSPLRIYNERRSTGTPAAGIEDALVDTVLERVGGGINVSEYALGSATLPASDTARIETPFLQLIMTRLWDEERGRGSAILRLTTLHELGGAENIVRSHLDQVMSRFSPGDQQLASRVFRYLITRSGTKIAHSAEDLAGYTHDSTEDVERLLERLSAGTDRILRPVPAAPERPYAARYEIFHDRVGQAILGWLARFGRKEAADEAARQATVIASSPISTVTVDADEPDEGPTTLKGTALCLAGSGYRAMLFHLGALWRLNQLGILARLDQISSVSTGSFVAARLAVTWNQLEFDTAGIARRLESAVVEPVRSLARHSIDVANIVRGILQPGRAAKRLDAYLAKYLLDGAVLDELPDRPRIVLVASNMQNGALWLFTRNYMGDYLTGDIRPARLRLATAAACSGASSPVLSPMQLTIPADVAHTEGSAPLSRVKPRRVYLTDGLVLDRLAIQTAWKQHRDILVSDGTGKLMEVDKPSGDWMRQYIRVIEMIDWQARGAQKRQLIESFRNGARGGTYWGIGSDIADYALPDVLPCPLERTTRLSLLPARLSKIEDTDQERLINWGYAVCDAAIRRHYLLDALRPRGFPYPSAGV